MTLIDLLSEITEELLGTPKEITAKKMKEYAEKNTPPPGFYRELSDEEVSRWREAARKDPEGFIRWAMEGAIEARMH